MYVFIYMGDTDERHLELKRSYYAVVVHFPHSQLILTMELVELFYFYDIFLWCVINIII